MALPSTIYRVSLHLADTDRDRYEHLQTTMAQHPSETAERLIARLFAFALCHEEGLVFTKGVSAGDEPDLWVKGMDGRVRLWVEVGLPEPERLLKASRHCSRVVLFACGSGRSRWEYANLAKLSNTPNLTVYGIDFGFLQNLAGHLQRTLDWSLTVTGGMLYLTIGDLTLETHLSLLAGSPDS
jgi:uncharacterized protein YaeQ